MLGYKLHVKRAVTKHSSRKGYCYHVSSGSPWPFKLARGHEGVIVLARVLERSGTVDGSEEACQVLI